MSTVTLSKLKIILARARTNAVLSIPVLATLFPQSIVDSWEKDHTHTYKKEALSSESQRH